jgi:hypothetical protein
MTGQPISSGSGTSKDPWRLKTPPLSSEYTMHRDTRDGVAVIVCTVGKTVLLYDARCLDDLHAMLVAHGDWMELGSADEQKPAKDGTVEAWGRSPNTSASPRLNTTHVTTGYAPSEGISAPRHASRSIRSRSWRLSGDASMSIFTTLPSTIEKSHATRT